MQYHIWYAKRTPNGSSRMPILLIRLLGYSGCKACYRTDGVHSVYIHFSTCSWMIILVRFRLRPARRCDCRSSWWKHFELSWKPLDLFSINFGWFHTSAEQNMPSTCRSHDISETIDSPYSVFWTSLQLIIPECSIPRVICLLPVSLCGRHTKRT